MDIPALMGENKRLLLFSCIAMMMVCLADRLHPAAIHQLRRIMQGQNAHHKVKT